MRDWMSATTTQSEVSGAVFSAAHIMINNIKATQIQFVVQNLQV